MEKMECEDQRESTAGDARKEENEHQPFKKQRLKDCEQEGSKASGARKLREPGWTPEQDTSVILGSPHHPSPIHG